MTDFVYVFADPLGFRKVGISSNPLTRFDAVQTGNPHRLVFETHAECPEARAVEQEVHRLLAEHRAVGEWFFATAEQVDAAIDAAWFAVRGCFPLGDHPTNLGSRP